MDDVQLTQKARTGAAPAPGDTVRAFRSWLAGLDPAGLSDRERIDLVAEIERVKGTGAAAQARLTHAARQSREASCPQDATRSVGAEVALARRQSPTLGDRFVGLAAALVDEMPCTMRALSSGSCSERHALLMVQATSVLSLEHRAEVDRRVGPLLGRLGVRGAERAARRVAQELDVTSVLRRMEDAVRSRRVTVRPAPDGMAYLTVLGPLVEVVGASAALRARAQCVVTGQAADEAPYGRATGAIAADTALSLLSGRTVGAAQAVEVHLVMTDRSLLGTGDPDRSVMEPARIPGHGPLPAPWARAWLRGNPRGGATVNTSADTGPLDTAPLDSATVWVRRLYTSPDGRDLVAMDSRRRLFDGLLRRMLVLRDDVCTTPWCEAPIAHADHTTPSRAGGVTSLGTGTGKCARCNYGKEAPGWLTVAVPVGADPESAGPSTGVTTEVERHDVHVRTPLGRRYVSQPPPLLGWGWSLTAEAASSHTTFAPASLPTGDPSAGEGPRGVGSVAAPPPSRPARRADRVRGRVLASAGSRVTRIPFAPHLELELCRYRT